MIVAPGQGAQTPGFLAPWLEESEFADRIDWYSAACGLDLAHFGSRADADTIMNTAVAQPLIVAAGILATHALFAGEAVHRPDLAAGHSVGEITAAAGAGVLTPEQAMVFVRLRGRAMAEAAAGSDAGMAAVLGGDADEVLS